MAVSSSSFLSTPLPISKVPKFSETHPLYIYRGFAGSTDKKSFIILYYIISYYIISYYIISYYIISYYIILYHIILYYITLYILYYIIYIILYIIIYYYIDNISILIQ